MKTYFNTEIDNTTNNFFPPEGKYEPFFVRGQFMIKPGTKKIGFCNISHVDFMYILKIETEKINDGFER